MTAGSSKAEGGRSMKAKHLGLVCMLVGVSLSLDRLNAAEILEEIVVTAQKREQNIQDIGLSVTALTGEQIETFGYDLSSDVAQHAVALQVYEPLGPSLNVNYAIRGVGISGDFTDQSEGAVTSYVDEFYVQTLQGVAFGLFDLNRVEILRGPQGTLFGRNSTGGAVHFVTNKPKDSLEASAEVQLGSYDEVRVEGFLGGPLLPGVMGRFSFLKHEHDGYLKNLSALPDGRERDLYSVRGQLLYEPNDDLRMLIKVEHGESDSNAQYYEHIATFRDANGLSHDLPNNEDFYGTCPGCDAYGFRESQTGSEDANRVFTDSPQNAVISSDHILGRIEWDVHDNVSLTSVTGYLDSRRDEIEDVSGSPSLFNASFDVDTTEFMEEVRLSGTAGKLGWNVGAFYINTKSNADIDNVVEFADGTTAVDGIVGGFDTRWKQKIDSWALFAQAEYDVYENLTVIGGVRYSNEDKEMTQRAQFLLFNGGLLAALPPLPGRGPNEFGFTPVITLVDFLFTKNNGNDNDREEELITSKLALEWTPTDDILAYTSWSRGTKAGGFNAGFVLDAAAVPYEDELINAYEIGLKSDWVNGRVRVNAAVFYYDYSDYQVFRFENIVNRITNSDARLYGAEAEVAVALTEHIDLSFAASVLDTKIKDVDNGTFTENKEMPLAPSVGANGILRFHWPVWNGEGAFQADFFYRDDMFSTPTNDPSAVLPETVVGNARLTYTTGDKRWDVELFVKNIADNVYLVGRSDLADFGFWQERFSEPRWVGGSVRYTWR